LLQQGLGTLKFLAYDLAQVYANGVFVAQLWRAGSLSGVPVTSLSSFCPHPPSTAPHDGPAGSQSLATVELTLLVASYGRENFFTVGQSSEVQKGIVGDVAIQWIYNVNTGHDSKNEVSNMTLTDWQVYATPLIQPGRVLRWPQGEPEKSTHDLISSRNRKPFDSMHGGVWRQKDHVEVSASQEDDTVGGASVLEPRSSGRLETLPLKLQKQDERGDETGSQHDLHEDESADGIGMGGRSQRSSQAVQQTNSPSQLSQTITSSELNEGHDVQLGVAAEKKILSAVKQGQALVHGPVFYR
jgi:hypothetical protein